MPFIVDGVGQKAVPSTGFRMGCLLPCHHRLALLPHYLHVFPTSLGYCFPLITSPWMRPFSSTISYCFSFDKIRYRASLFKKIKINKKPCITVNSRDFIGPNTQDTELGRTQYLHFIMILDKILFFPTPLFKIW